MDRAVPAAPAGRPVAGRSRRCARTAADLAGAPARSPVEHGLLERRHDPRTGAPTGCSSPKRPAARRRSRQLARLDRNRRTRDIPAEPVGPASRRSRHQGAHQESLSNPMVTSLPSSVSRPAISSRPSKWFVKTFPNRDARPYKRAARSYQRHRRRGPGWTS